MAQQAGSVKEEIDASVFPTCITLTYTDEVMWFKTFHFDISLHTKRLRLIINMYKPSRSHQLLITEAEDVVGERSYLGVNFLINRPLGLLFPLHCQQLHQGFDGHALQGMRGTKHYSLFTS